MTNEDVAKWTERINNMSHEDMARSWRFHPAGSVPYFDTTSPLWPIFKARWKEFGGWNPDLSKKIGW